MTSRRVFFVDENLPAELGRSLHAVFKRHRFRSVLNEMSGMKDIELFGQIAVRGGEVLITADTNQLLNPLERDAIRQNGLHWIGLTLPMVGGRNFVAIQTAAALEGFRYALDHWAPTPTSYSVSYHTSVIVQHTL